MRTKGAAEIVVSLAAVRIGAIELGIGNVLGSNLLNLFLAVVTMKALFLLASPIG